MVGAGLAVIIGFAWALVGVSTITLLTWSLRRRRRRGAAGPRRRLPGADDPLDPELAVPAAPDLPPPASLPRGLSKAEINGAAPVSVFLPEAPPPEAPPPAAPPPGPAADPPGPAAEVVCCVCLEDVRPGERLRTIGRCGHRFHSVCIRKWLKRENRCPLCTREVVDRGEGPAESPEVELEETRAEEPVMGESELLEAGELLREPEVFEAVAMRHASVLSAPVEARNQSISLTSFTSLAQPQRKHRVVSWLQKLPIMKLFSRRWPSRGNAQAQRPAGEVNA